MIYSCFSSYLIFMNEGEKRNRCDWVFLAHLSEKCTLETYSLLLLPTSLPHPLCPNIAYFPHHQIQKKLRCKEAFLLFSFQAQKTFIFLQIRFFFAAAPEYCVTLYYASYMHFWWCGTSLNFSVLKYERCNTHIGFVRHDAVLSSFLKLKDYLDFLWSHYILFT